MKNKVLLLCALLIALIAAPAAAQDDEFVFGLVLVGPEDDGGWSQAHYEGGLYVEENIPGARMVVFESLNTADAPETTLLDVVTEMVEGEGAELIFTTSDAFEEDTNVVAEAFPDVTFINVSGDDVLNGTAPANIGNLMGQMEWGKLIAGCAAGLTTETGNIGYLGPLINNETRRLAASAYLGARHCYEQAGGNPEELTFTVTWIGFWFNIPGVTLDTTEETNTFFDSGADVVISGIDTTEAITIAGQRRAEGENVYAVPYDFAGACAEAPEACLGVPYFNWGPDYVDIVEAVRAGEWEPEWVWTAPDWDDINNRDTSAIGFVKGEGLSEEDSAALDAFIADLTEYATNPLTQGGFALWVGPLATQDGTVLAEEGEVVDPLDVWYLGSLLEGMVGASE